MAYPSGAALSAHSWRASTAGLSTVAQDWSEGTGTDAPTEGGSCFTHAIYPNNDGQESKAILQMSASGRATHLMLLLK